LVFRPLRTEGNPSANPDGTVSGEFVLDKLFDGKKNLHPIGVIYMVSGAGGAALYGAAPQLPDATNFIDKFNSSTHSLTLCEVNHNELKLSQISEDGTLIDSFKIQK
jgi:acid phosphatase type 7